VRHHLSVNGSHYEIDGDPLEPLSTALRDGCGLQGTKVGCGEGRCGACTVLVDGDEVVSCLYPLGLAEGAEIRTVEGLPGPDGELDDLQRALLDAGGVQCGACTPGVLMTLTAFLGRTPDPTAHEVREALIGNICRCTGYHKIVDAALAVAEARA
jgi:carbon-monoxide dehydrogenase small subunit